MSAGLVDTVRWFVVTSAELAALFFLLTLAVGAVQARLPDARLRALLGERRPALGYLGGAAFGAVTPFCSFTTVPVLAGLIRARAPFGPTMTFLIASPLLDPVVIGVLAFVVGVPGAAAYTVLTFSASIALGLLTQRLGMDRHLRRVPAPAVVGPPTVRADASACAPDDTTDDRQDASHLRGQALLAESWGSFRRLSPYLLVGTALGALVHGLVPVAWVASVAGPGQWFGVPVAAALGIPVYVSAETFFPVASALLDKGASSGAVVALVVTSMGVSVPEMVMLGGLLRVRLVLALVAAVFVTALATGYAAMALTT